MDSTVLEKSLGAKRALQDQVMFWFGCKSQIARARALSLMCQQHVCYCCTTAPVKDLFPLNRLLPFSTFPVTNPQCSQCFMYLYYAAAPALAYGWVPMAPGEACEGQQKSPVTFPQCSFFPAPLSASCDSLRSPPSEGIQSTIMAVNPIKLHTMKLKYSLD